VYLVRRSNGNPFIHQFHLKNGDKAVENFRLWWIDCGQRVDNPLTALLEQAKREEENETFEHKKREPLIGSLVANRIKYTLFLPKNQALALLQGAHGLRNEMYFCAQVASQARSMLAFFYRQRVGNTSALEKQERQEGRPQAKLLLSVHLVAQPVGGGRSLPLPQAHHG